MNKPVRELRQEWNATFFQCNKTVRRVLIKQMYLRGLIEQVSTEKSVYWWNTTCLMSYRNVEHGKCVVFFMDSILSITSQKSNCRRCYLKKNNVANIYVRANCKESTAAKTWSYIQGSLGSIPRNINSVVLSPRYWLFTGSDGYKNS